MKGPMLFACAVAGNLPRVAGARGGGRFEDFCFSPSFFFVCSLHADAFNIKEQKAVSIISSHLPKSFRPLHQLPIAGLHYFSRANNRSCII